MKMMEKEMEMWMEMGMAMEMGMVVGMEMETVKMVAPLSLTLLNN